MRLLRTAVAFRMNLATLRNRKRTEIIAKLREAVKGVEGEVFLVGSWARGDFDSFSDKDLLALVDREDDRDRVFNHLDLIGDDVLVFTRAEYEKRLA
jgi:predicted nucleotidyltransferase